MLSVHFSCESKSCYMVVFQKILLSVVPRGAMFGKEKKKLKQQHAKITAAQSAVMEVFDFCDRQPEKDTGGPGLKS